VTGNARETPDLKKKNTSHVMKTGAGGQYPDSLSQCWSYEAPSNQRLFLSASTSNTIQPTHCLFAIKKRRIAEEQSRTKINNGLNNED
jgi:hypothetical protein